MARLAVTGVGVAAIQQRPRTPEEYRQRAADMSDRANQRIAGEAFVGVTTDGEVAPGPAKMRHLMPPNPSRQHIHVVVRTPNGNDYGEDLLRQHLTSHPHA